ncbi:MAG TPA: prepilin-type N-terminal cleavage/methylation domain-containing protein [Meiothermus sp.]|jgi:prepilin-type N-terminal cleavage/methylation domain-containing protein|nr:prepilin-type N-terminal cleavage/methylation domain-containing protein [Meiothermus sp.]
MKAKGFTLIELLIVISIITLLSAALVPNLLQARNAAHNQATRAFIREVVIGVESQRDPITNDLPPASSTCEELAGKTPGPGAIKRCKYEPDTGTGTYTITAESQSGKIYKHSGNTTIEVASY